MLADYSTQQNASRSPLLKLPAELREIIYNLVLADLKIRVCGKLKCDYCQRQKELDRQDNYPWKDPSNPSAHGKDSHWLDQGIHYPHHLLALTATRRQIHAETCLIPFESNVFCGYLLNLDAILSGWLLPFQIAALRKLHIYSRSALQRRAFPSDCTIVRAAAGDCGARRV